MVSFKLFQELAMAFPEVTSAPHFEKTSFKVKKKIFATYDENTNRVCLKLSESDQSIFSLIDKTIIFPIPNKWGKQGWTFVEMGKIDKDLFLDLLKAAYCEVAPKKLAGKILSENIK